MSHDLNPVTRSWRPAGLLVAAVVALYLLSLIGGWPQTATEKIVAQLHAGPAESAHEPHASPPPPWYTVIPFVLLLGAIAVLPLVPATAHRWESNLYRFYVSAAFAALSVAYYLFLHPTPIVGHFPVPHLSPAPAGEIFHWGTVGDLLANALLQEYLPFIILLFSLFTICGGIRIEGDLPAHPLTNTIFLAVGTALASFIGTTGAAMVLIRPLLHTNRERKHVAHTVVFFIFTVCNCGGCLLPLGDPPLFLGYLQGVPFLWTLNLWQEWLVTNCLLLAIYFLWDHFYFYPRETPRDLALEETRVHRLRFAGIPLNGVLLAGVVLAVALLDPTKEFLGTSWHPWLYLREAVMLGLVALSMVLGSPHSRTQNQFNFAPIVEVAVLFFGIFICMQPALQILDAEGAKLGIDTPHKFFWATGGLSSFLDNAPTYLVFFETARTLTDVPGPLVAGVPQTLLISISLGAVFMGAMTYIGNGPNFMVKSIAERSGIKMPGFFGYMVYSCCILLPLLVLLSLVWL